MCRDIVPVEEKKGAGKKATGCADQLTGGIVAIAARLPIAAKPRREELRLRSSKRRAIVVATSITFVELSIQGISSGVFNVMRYILVY